MYISNFSHLLLRWTKGWKEGAGMTETSMADVIAIHFVIDCEVVCKCSIFDTKNQKSVSTVRRKEDLKNARNSPIPEDGPVHRVLASMDFVLRTVMWLASLFSS
jgi:hypothetical protein